MMELDVLNELQAILYKKPSLFVFETRSDRSAPVFNRLSAKNPDYKDTPAPNTYNQPSTLREFSRDYILGSQKAIRFRDLPADESNFYDCKIKDGPARTSKKPPPFNVKAERCSRSLKTFDNPPVGSYNVQDAHKNIGKRVTWQCDTNLKPVNIPYVTHHSTIKINTGKLSSTIEEKRYHRKLEYFKLYY